MLNKSKRVLLLVLLVTLLPKLTLAETVFYDQSVAGQSAVTLKSPNAPVMSGNTGALQYSYNFTSDISLSYNSNSDFSLTIPFIKRVNNYGIENMFTRDDYTSSLYGDLVKSTTTDIFVLKNNNTSFLEFQKQGAGWEATDKNGTKYIYSQTDTNGYIWYLTDVTDIFGKNTHYTYTIDEGYIYPSSVTYDKIYELRFTWEDRPDKTESYQSGVFVKNNKRLFGVELFVQNEKKKDWKLRYTTGVNGVKSLLAGITEQGLPETTFDYSKNITEKKQINIGGNFDRVMDINADGLNDFVYARKTIDYNDPSGDFKTDKTIYLNKGDGTFQTISDAELPFFFSENMTNVNITKATNIFATDYDGDGLVDILGAQLKGKVGTTTLSWEKDNSIPNFQYGFQSANLNGDIQSDLVQTPYTQNNNQLLEYYSTVYFDVNHDGLDDKIKYYAVNEPLSGTSAYYDHVYKNIWINTGKDFVALDASSTEKYDFPISYKFDAVNGYTTYNNIYADTNFDGEAEATRVQDSTIALDVNGDGLADVCQPYGIIGTNSQLDCEMSVMKSDLLTKIKSNLGAETQITYKAESGTTYPVWTVKNISVNDGVGNISTTNYSYEKPYISRPNRVETKFAGFGKVTTTEPNNLKKIFYYHQGDGESLAKIGKVYKQEVLDENNILLNSNLFTYEEFTNPVSPSSTTVLLAQNINTEGNFSVQKDFTYDNNLNLIMTVGGDVGDASSTKTTELKYNNSNIHTNNYLPTEKTVKDISGNILGQEKYFYDGNLDTTITQGLVTQKDIYVSSTTKVSEKNIYDTSSGNILSTINSRGATTTLEYDSYKLFPISSTNALGHKTTFVYDYANGKVKKTIDPNGLVLETVYDTFGREIKSMKNGELLSETVYTDTYLPEIKNTKYFSDTDSVSTITSYDGLGRPIKEKQENANAGFTNFDRTYDSQGNIKKESLPYKNYSYDILGRLTETETPLGTDKVKYAPRSKITIDKNNHEQNFFYNKDGQITKVTEHNAGEIYNTNYTYDLLGNLTKVTDSENKERNISYDWLGRKIQDDKTGYEYGGLGEYTEITFLDGKKQKTNFDILGRKIDTFTYDTCENGIGKLCQSNSLDGVNKKYFYNTSGELVKVDTQVTNATWSPHASVSYSYDRQGNILTEADGKATTSKTYFKNYLQNISYSDTNSTTTNIFSNPLYSFTGQILSYDRGNLKTVNTFDDQNLYRLKNLALIKYGENSYNFAELNNATSTLPQYISETKSKIQTTHISSGDFIQITPNSAAWFANFAYRYPYLNVNSTGDTASWSTSKNQGLSATTTIGGYYNLFVQDKVQDTFDNDSYIRLFRRNSYGEDANTISGSGYTNETFNQCDTSHPYSDKIMYSDIATDTYLHIPLNTSFFTDYFTSSSTNPFISVCLLDGHTIKKSPSNNALIFNLYYYELFNRFGYAEAYKINAGMTVNYNTSNIRPAIQNLKIDFAGQGLYPKINIQATDADNDSLKEYEIYLKDKLNDKKHYLYNSATSTIVINDFPFTHNTSYDLSARVKDSAGDWSTLATSTFTTLPVNATTTKAYCKNIPNTPLGSVLCPDPVFYIENNLQIASSSFSNSKLLKPNTKYFYQIGSSSTSSTVYTFTTGDFKTFQNSTYSYDTLGRIKQIEKDDDSKYEKVTYTYDELSRLLTATKNAFTETFNYSPTGKILNGASDTVSFDLRGRLATSTLLGNLLWDDFDRLKEKTKNSSTTKYFYDTDGNRVMSLSSDTKLFTPTNNILDTGSTTSYTISLGNKPIVNIDRSYIMVPSTTISTSTQLVTSTSIVLKNISIDGTFTGTNNTETVHVTADSKLDNVRPYVGLLNTQTKQRFKFTDLIPGETQKLIINTLGNLGTRNYTVKVVAGVGQIVKNDNFVLPNSTNAYNNRPTTLTVPFVASTTDITLELSTPSNNNNYFKVDNYNFKLNKYQTKTTQLTSTTSTTSYIETWNTNIQTLITDHLNSIEKVLDFQTGNTIATSTYSAFGQQTKEGKTNSNRGFTNHQADTDLVYMNARYMSPFSDTFLSTDEFTKNLSSASPLLANPQALNQYSYAWNNPVNAYDPDGRLTIIVPGTFYDSNVWSFSNTDTNFFTNIMATFKDNTIIWNQKSDWSGNNSYFDRRDAALNIAGYIGSYKFAKGEQLNLVGHSHGGNIIKDVSDISTHKIDNAILFATPQRGDYDMNMENVNNYVNVYSHLDIVPGLIGGNTFSIDNPASWFGGVKSTWQELGIAGWKDDSATQNINLTWQTSKSLFDFPFGPISGPHSDLWSNGNFWSKYVAPVVNLQK